MTANNTRARDLGIELRGEPGPLNAITDVDGVEVGYATLISGDGSTIVGSGPVRTGVTAILPRGRNGVGRPCAAGRFSFNGNGEMTGTAWIDEVGELTLPITISNTHAVGECHTGVIEWINEVHPRLARQWLLPICTETWDGYLNDINGGHVTPEVARQAIDSARTGAVAEGSVGGGTGMNCYGFKGAAARRRAGLRSVTPPTRSAHSSRRTSARARSSRSTVSMWVDWPTSRIRWRTPTGWNKSCARPQVRDR